MLYGKLTGYLDISLVTPTCLLQILGFKIIHLIAGLRSFKKLTKNLPLDAGLNVFEPNRSNLEPWKDGIKACNKLMKKNVQERLNMANEIWQRYEDNLEEVSERKEKQ